MSDEFDDDGTSLASLQNNTHPLWNAPEVQARAPIPDRTCFSPKEVNFAEGIAGLGVTGPEAECYDTVSEKEISRPVRAAMLDTWDKACFIGGYTEVEFAVPITESAVVSDGVGWCEGCVGGLGYGVGRYTWGFGGTCGMSCSMRLQLSMLFWKRMRGERCTCEERKIGAERDMWGTRYVCRTQHAWGAQHLRERQQAWLAITVRLHR